MFSAWYRECPARTRDNSVATMTRMSEEMNAELVRRVATLSRLELDDATISRLTGQLSDVLAYIERLRELDLEGVEPMAHPTTSTNRWDVDEPSTPMSRDTLMDMAPETHPPFIRVPRVLGDGGGA